MLLSFESSFLWFFLLLLVWVFAVVLLTMERMLQDCQKVSPEVDPEAWAAWRDSASVGQRGSH